MVSEAMYCHAGRAPKLLEFGSRGHVRSTSLIAVKEEDGALTWKQMQTGWHGFYKIEGTAMELNFRWRHPTQFTIPHKLKWVAAADGSQGIWSNDDIDLYDAPHGFKDRLQRYDLYDGETIADINAAVWVESTQISGPPCSG